MNQIRSIKGTHDILPAQSKDWQDLENQIHKTANLYGYQEIRTPIIENAALFNSCLLYTSPSPRDLSTSRMPSSA